MTLCGNSQSFAIDKSFDEMEESEIIYTYELIYAEEGHKDDFNVSSQSQPVQRNKSYLAILERTLASCLALPYGVIQKKEKEATLKKEDATDAVLFGGTAYILCKIQSDVPNERLKDEDMLVLDNPSQISNTLNTALKGESANFFVADILADILNYVDEIQLIKSKYIDRARPVTKAADIFVESTKSNVVTSPIKDDTEKYVSNESLSKVASNPALSQNARLSLDEVKNISEIEQMMDPLMFYILFPCAKIFSKR